MEKVEFEPEPEPKPKLKGGSSSVSGPIRKGLARLHRTPISPHELDDLRTLTDNF